MLGRDVSDLDPLAPVDERVTAVRVDPADGEEGIGLGEDVLLLQVGAGQLERDLVLQTRLLLHVDGDHAAVPGLVSERGKRPSRESKVTVISD